MTAARLAEAGLRVLVLERGPWFGNAGGPDRQPVTRPYPRGLKGLAGSLRALTRTDHRGDRVRSVSRTGMFDVHIWPGVTNVVGSGVGGGSLVYAGFQGRPATGYFRDHFPAEITDAEMAPHFAAAETMQRPQVVPHPVASRPIFQEGLTRAGLGQAQAATMAVEFGDPDRPELRINAAGHPQTTCRACGACVLGCEYGSKTTLDLTYVTLAGRCGAEIRALCEVTGIGGGPNAYEVLWRDLSTGTDHLVRTPRLVLSAGTIGTLRLLYAARDKHRTLPDLPPTLGHNFSGNGDYLTMVSGSRAATHHGRHVMFQNVHLLDDGGFIGEAAPPITQLPLPKPVRRRLSETVFLFGMGPEPATRLLSAGGAPFATPYKPANQAFYTRMNERVQQLAQAYRPSGVRPNWPLGPDSDRLITVHPVGGASIGQTAQDGVVDHRGEVFGHPGLFVADGSTFPAAPGVPPSLTIAALAERQAALMIGADS